VPIASDPALAEVASVGQTLWRQRIGQLDLSCAQCHDDRAGLRLGGTPIPQAHATAYPVYRLEWQGLGSLQRRLRNCMTGVRAAPYAFGSPEYLALEVFLARRSAGMPHEGPGVRP
jgi:sulfur-oxidizing protein SoxA